MPPIETVLLPQGNEDAALVAQLRAGHPPAFVALMRRHNQRLFRLARGVVGDDAEAEEVVQESYLRAFTHLDGFEGRSSLATWLGRIVINEALGRLRRRRPSIAVDAIADPADDSPSARADSACPERALARQEGRRAIERAVDDLPAAFRSVFIMRAIEQMSIEETAICLPITPHGSCQFFAAKENAR
jgi:RNA polymerase sigma-70 factor (ECF subfamily)